MSKQLDLGLGKCIAFPDAILLNICNFVKFVPHVVVGSFHILPTMMFAMKKFGKIPIPDIRKHCKLGAS